MKPSSAYNQVMLSFLLPMCLVVLYLNNDMAILTNNELGFILLILSQTWIKRCMLMYRWFPIILWMYEPLCISTVGSQATDHGSRHREAHIMELGCLGDRMRSPEHKLQFPVASTKMFLWTLVAILGRTWEDIWLPEPETSPTVLPAECLFCRSIFLYMGEILMSSF